MVALNESQHARKKVGMNGGQLGKEGCLRRVQRVWLEWLEGAGTTEIDGTMCQQKRAENREQELNRRIG